MSSDRYELIDFGDGRKLESFSGYLIDRPCPAAQDTHPQDLRLWSEAGARFDAQTSSWMHHRPWPRELDIDCGPFRMPVYPLPSGHIGVFPEQAVNWRWLAEPRSASDDQPHALNLFAYTGASTMALVSAGYDVAHVDAAKPSVQAARKVALHNGYGDAPIRFLVDDAVKFANREVRRGRHYHTVVMDPPSYGHSPRGKAWRIERDLWPLLEACFQLMDPQSFRLLITGHSPETDESVITRFLKENQFLNRAAASAGLLLEFGRSQLKDSWGRSLDAGFYVRAASRGAAAEIPDDAS